MNKSISNSTNNISNQVPYFPTSNYSIKSFKFSESKYRFSIRGPISWKGIPTISKNSVKKKLLEIENNKCF